MQVDEGVIALEIGEPWQRMHAALCGIASRRGQLDAEELECIVAARAAAVHARLGYTSFHEYLVGALGYGVRQARERMRVAEALEALPALQGALADGRLSYSAVRELSRFVVPATERAWLAASEGRTVREVEAMAAGRRIGDLPDTPVERRPRPRTLRLAVTDETRTKFRVARERLERQAGRSLSDDEVLGQLCDAVLDGAAPGGAPPAAAVAVVETEAEEPVASASRDRPERVEPEPGVRIDEQTVLARSVLRRLGVEEAAAAAAVDRAVAHVGGRGGFPAVLRAALRGCEGPSGDACPQGPPADAISVGVSASDGGVGVTGD